MTRKPTHTVSATALSGSVGRTSTRVVAEEVPVALVYNGTTHAVMMATPADLKDFAIGFTLSEGIVDATKEIERLEILEHEEGMECQMLLSPDAEASLTERRRFIAGPVGCGLCGVDSVEQALRPLPTVGDINFRLDISDIYKFMSELPKYQTLHDQTHSVHGAAFATPTGIVEFREDVGRHNALDKLIGAMARHGKTMSDGAVVITSRLSVELVQKTVQAGCPILIAISAPTALAIRLAEETGLTLVAFARDDGLEIFTHPHRITLQEAPDVA